MVAAVLLVLIPASAAFAAYAYDYVPMLMTTGVPVTFDMLTNA